MEIWKIIKGFDYEYKISNYGRVFLPKNKGGIFTLGSKDTYGYLRVSLYKNKKGIGKKVHRLVAEYFLENFKENLTVNHIDFDKTNNHVNNLESISNKDNISHYFNNKKKSKTSSKYIGVGYHIQLKKWTARVTFEEKRYSIGTFNTEQEAYNAIINFKGVKSELKIGKGSSLIGKCKYSKEEDIKAILLANKIGVRKAGVITKMGSTRISTLRKKEEYLKFVNLKNGNS